MGLKARILCEDGRYKGNLFAKDEKGKSYSVVRAGNKWDSLYFSFLASFAGESVPSEVPEKGRQILDVELESLPGTAFFKKVVAPSDFLAVYRDNRVYVVNTDNSELDFTFFYWDFRPPGIGAELAKINRFIGFSFVYFSTRLPLLGYVERGASSGVYPVVNGKYIRFDNADIYRKRLADTLEMIVKGEHPSFRFNNESLKRVPLVLIPRDANYPEAIDELERRMPGKISRHKIEFIVLH